MHHPDKGSMMSAKETQTESSTSSVPLFATQGGGYAIFTNGKFVWHSEIPAFLFGTEVGDEIPEEWGTAAINEAARLQMEDDDPFISSFFDEDDMT